MICTQPFPCFFWSSLLLAFARLRNLLVFFARFPFPPKGFTGSPWMGKTFEVIAFLEHTPGKSEIMGLQNEGFPQNCREIAQIVGGQNVESMHVKRSDPEKDYKVSLIGRKSCLFLWVSLCFAVHF